MKSVNSKPGFSAVELLITLFIAAAFFISGSQLYSAVIKDGGNINMMARASDTLATYLQNYKTKSHDPCTPETLLSDSPITVAGLSNVTIGVKVACQNNSTAASFFATGGIKTIEGAYTVHKFTSSGIFTYTGPNSVEVLVVAGGGGGGKAEANPGGDGAGGGGAGGVVYNATYVLSGQNTQTTVTVGNGGLGTTSGTYPTIPRGGNGGNSIFGSITATGGGGGGSDNDDATGLNMGANGGSGGGASNRASVAVAASSGIAGQGFAGGNAVTNPATWRGGSGGGGSGAVGAARVSNIGGAGGAGSLQAITGITYAGGGGGGGCNAAGGAGGSGGAGAGGGVNGNGIDATPNTGSGGGGGGSNNGSGGDGGSGIVIIRYLTPSKALSKITATIKYGSPQKTLTNATYAQPKCPTGFINVPGSTTYGTSDFCVMKYEAKSVSGGVASVAAGTPWVSISQINAAEVSKAACPGCHLITEAEWMTIAQNALSVPTNWSGNAVGSGYIYGGHSDNDPSGMIAASEDDSIGYFGTNTADPPNNSSQRRTLTLTNGEVIWDLSGNAREWTAGQTAGGQPGLVGESAFAYKEWKNATVQGSLAVNPFPSSTLLPNSANWDSTNGIGQLYSNSSDTSLRVFRRGGSYGAGSSGILALEIYSSPSATSGYIGFRVAK